MAQPLNGNNAEISAQCADWHMLIHHFEVVFIIYRKQYVKHMTATRRMAIESAWGRADDGMATSPGYARLRQRVYLHFAKHGRCEDALIEADERAQRK